MFKLPLPDQEPDRNNASTISQYLRGVHPPRKGVKTNKHKDWERKKNKICLGTKQDPVGLPDVEARPYSCS